VSDWAAPKSVDELGGIELAPGVRVPESALTVQFARSGGPGGQNVNKLNTKAEIWLAMDAVRGRITQRAFDRLVKLAGKRLTLDGQIHLASEAHRSQEQNRQEAMERLRELLVSAMVEPKVRRKTKPSRRAKERRLEGKRRRSIVKARRQGRES
jgi:ribosome-associated protein